MDQVLKVFTDNWRRIWEERSLIALNRPIFLAFGVVVFLVTGVVVGFAEYVWFSSSINSRDDEIRIKSATIENLQNKPTLARPTTTIEQQKDGSKVTYPGSALRVDRFYSAKNKEAVSDILDKVSKAIAKSDEIFLPAEAMINGPRWDSPGQSAQSFIERLDKISLDVAAIQTLLFEDLYRDYPDYREELNSLLFPMDDFGKFREGTTGFRDGLSVWVALKNSADTNLTQRPDFSSLVNTAKKAFAEHRDRFLVRMTERSDRTGQTRRALRNE